MMVAGLILTASAAIATTFEIDPPDHDIYDLDHYKAYEWGFEFVTLQPNEVDQFGKGGSVPLRT